MLVAGKKDHGPGEHDYPAWQTQWGQLLAAAPNLNLSAAWEFPSDDQIQSADVLIFFQKGTWNDERAKQIDAYLARGGGAVYIHWAVNGDQRVADFSQRIGLASKGGSIRYRHGPTVAGHSQYGPSNRSQHRSLESVRRKLLAPDGRRKERNAARNEHRGRPTDAAVVGLRERSWSRLREYSRTLQLDFR